MPIISPSNSKMNIVRYNLTYLLKFKALFKCLEYVCVCVKEQKSTCEEFNWIKISEYNNATKYK